MSVTYTMDLTGFKIQSTNNLSNVIVQTTWTMTGTDANGNTGVFSGATPFDANTINANSFISYSNLTSNIVLGWVANVISSNPTYNSHITTVINDQIALKYNPVNEVSGNDFPWITK